MYKKSFIQILFSAIFPKENLTMICPHLSLSLYQIFQYAIQILSLHEASFTIPITECQMLETT